MINLLLSLVVISWQPVPQAEGYIVTICEAETCNEVNVGDVLSYDSDIPVGRVVSVRAYNQGGSYMGPKSSEVTIGSLGEPSTVVRED